MAIAMQKQVSKVAGASTRKAAAPRPFNATRSAVRSVVVRASAAGAPSAAKAPRRAEAVVPQAAAAPAAPSTSSGTKEWYALVASAEFFFNDAQNESVAEQLRERVRFFKEQNRDRDFYIVPEPKWLEAKYPEQAKKVKRPAVALVSTDKNWIIFMKLRLDRVLRFDLGKVEDSEVLAVGGELPEFKGPEKWTAPYSRYAPGWWKVFVPGAKQ